MVTDKEIIFHIGLHKTASTWLQNNLFHKGSPFFYHLNRKNNGDSSFAKCFFQDKDGYLLNSFDINLEKIYTEYKKYIDKKDPKDNRINVVSHERLSGNPHASYFDAKLIAERIKFCFPNAKILLLTRNPVDIITSNYFQYLSIGGTMSIKQYLNTKYDERRPYFNPKAFNYNSMKNNYANIFGADNVCLLEFEEFKTDFDKFLQQLNSFLKLRLNLNSNNINYKIKTNRSKDQFVIYHLRKLNSLTKSTSINNYYKMSRALKFLIISLLKMLKILTPDKQNRQLQNQVKKTVQKEIPDNS